MDSESTTNRKGFLKRAGLAIAGIFAVSTTARATASGRASSNASQGTAPGAPSAMARIRTAKGAVARKA